MSYQTNVHLLMEYMREHQAELLREADSIRLARSLSRARKPVLPRLTGSLGQALVSMGQWLIAHPVTR